MYSSSLQRSTRHCPRPPTLMSTRLRSRTRACTCEWVTLSSSAVCCSRGCSRASWRSCSARLARSSAAARSRPHRQGLPPSPPRPGSSPRACLRVRPRRPPGLRPRRKTPGPRRRGARAGPDGRPARRAPGPPRSAGAARPRPASRSPAGSWSLPLAGCCAARRARKALAALWAGSAQYAEGRPPPAERGDALVRASGEAASGLALHRAVLSPTAGRTSAGRVAASVAVNPMRGLRGSRLWERGCARPRQGGPARATVT